jgi:hypothetical protein
MGVHRPRHASAAIERPTTFSRLNAHADMVRRGAPCDAGSRPASSSTTRERSTRWIAATADDTVTPRADRVGTGGRLSEISTMVI